MHKIVYRIEKMCFINIEEDFKGGENDHCSLCSESSNSPDALNCVFLDVSQHTVN